MSKYKAKKCRMMFEYESYTFDSKAEMSHFAKLAHRLKRFEIEKLTLQPKYELLRGFTLNTDKTKSGKTKLPNMVYTPDFRYIENGKVIVVEVKGFTDTSFNIRKRLFLFDLELYGVDEYHLVFKYKIEKYWR